MLCDYRFELGFFYEKRKLNPPLNKLRLPINGILSFEISASTVCTCTFVPNILVLISEMTSFKVKFCLPGSVDEFKKKCCIVSQRYSVPVLNIFTIVPGQ